MTTTTTTGGGKGAVPPLAVKTGPDNITAICPNCGSDHLQYEEMIWAVRAGLQWKADLNEPQLSIDSMYDTPSDESIRHRIVCYGCDTTFAAPRDSDIDWR